MSYDVIVVGAGLAGLVAALRSAEEGARVALFSKGMGAVQLAPATIDVLGYGPERVKSPADDLPDWAARHPQHPYARLGLTGIRSALDWFVPRASALSYEGKLEDNLVLATAVGAVRPTAVAAGAIAGGDIRAMRRVAIVGWRSLKDFYAAYAADNLARTASEIGAELDVRAVEIERPNEAGADVGPLSFARRFEDMAWRRKVAAEVGGRLQAEDAVGFPAVLGLESHLEVWRDLEDVIGARVFEIPTLPPSVPGMRLLRVLKSALRAAGARLVIGVPVVGARASEGRIEAVIADSASRSRAVAAGQFVLATGGWASGGIEMDSRWRAREVVFGLPVVGIPSPGEERLRPGLFDDHPLDGSGLAVDDELRPVGEGGEPIYANLRAAGATLAGARPWREKSGDGISLSTGHRAACAILEEKS